MPAALIGGAVSAVGSIAGAASANKAAKKAAKAAAEGAAANRVEYGDYYKDAQSLYQPTIDRGNQYSGLIDGLNGLGDPAASQAAFNTWKSGTGYQNVMDDALGSVNSNAYATGLGNSGATLKALQDRAGQVANGTFNQYYNNLAGQQGLGMQAIGALDQANQYTTNGMTNANDTQYGAKAQSAIQKGQTMQNMFGQLGQTAMGVTGTLNANNNFSKTLAANQVPTASAYQSSFGGGATGINSLWGR